MRTKDKNRQDFPGCSKIIDEFRRTFGSIKVAYVEESGKKIGNKRTWSFLKFEESVNPVMIGVNQINHRH